jgi:hypothetical protein
LPRNEYVINITTWDDQPSRREAQAWLDANGHGESFDDLLDDFEIIESYVDLHGALTERPEVYDVVAPDFLVAESIVRSFIESTNNAYDFGYRLDAIREVRFEHKLEEVFTDRNYNPVRHYYIDRKAPVVRLIMSEGVYTF